MLLIDLGRYKPGAVQKLRRVFAVYGTGKFRPPVRRLFEALAGVFDGEALRRLAAPDAPGGRLELELPMLADFTEAELWTLRGQFAEWMNGFAGLDQAAADLFNDLAGLMDDCLREGARGARELEAVLSPLESDEAYWGEGGDQDG